MPRIGGEHPVDVRVNLANVGTERHRQRHRCGVRPTATQRCDVLGVLRHALEARDDRDVALVERLADPARRDVDDLRPAVLGVGDHTSLAAGEGSSLHAEVRDRHREQRHRDALARGQQHVELAGRRQRRHLRREVEELVGVVTHRGDDDAHVVTVLAGRDDPLCDLLDALSVGDGRATVFLDDDAHEQTTPRQG